MLFVFRRDGVGKCVTVPAGKLSLKKASFEKVPVIAPEWRQKILLRWKRVWRDALAASLAAVTTWFLAQTLFGHSLPVFAAISAVICLAPGLPSHSRQAVGILIGVGTGIVVGDLVLHLPEQWRLLQFALGPFLAMMIASSYGLPPVVPIQAGTSALLVVALGPETAGEARMADVALGAGIGLLFSQVLMTPDPVRVVDEAARGLLTRLAEGYRGCAEALRANDATLSEAALMRLSQAHASIISMNTSISNARDDARWSVRGRWVAKEVREMAARYDRHAIRLYAATLLFADNLNHALRQSGVPAPDSLIQRVETMAHICETMAVGDPLNMPEGADVPPDYPRLQAESVVWVASYHHLDLANKALKAFNPYTVRDR